MSHCFLFNDLSLIILVLTVTALSINARGKQEMLDDWHDLDLAEIEEELVEFFLVGAVKDQV